MGIRLVLNKYSLNLMVVRHLETLCGLALTSLHSSPSVGRVGRTEGKESHFEGSQLMGREIAEARRILKTNKNTQMRTR